MYSERKNDKTVMEAIRLSNNNQHVQAAYAFQRAGNQYRNPAEKKALWDAAARARRLAASD